MDWRTESVAVIPCLNEARSIQAVVAGARRQIQRVIVVDDGSTDQTAERAEQAGGEVLRRERSHGKGTALRWAWDHARRHGYQWAICMDGDGQHSPGDIPLFFECAERTSAALVVGNRMSTQMGMPWLRRVVNRWMSGRLSRLTGQALPDSQCGFRLMSLEAWSTLQLTATHFEVESELLVAFIRAEYPVAFVPIQTAYRDEQSKIRPLRDTIRWLRWYRQVSRRCVVPQTRPRTANLRPTVPPG